MTISIRGEMFELLWQKAMYWPVQGALLLADLHLGKITHFRKSGLPLPSLANERDCEVLIDLINTKQPKRIFFLGDLFHSHYNPEWEALGQIRKHFADVEFNLIPGNHDVLSDYQYTRHGIMLRPAIYQLGEFALSHYPDTLPEVYNIAGHLHPCFSIHGAARQSETLPCFVFGKNGGILPAFGAFTGMARFHPHDDDRVYIIVEKKILKAA